jgi:hypothetical protein
MNLATLAFRAFPGILILRCSANAREHQLRTFTRVSYIFALSPLSCRASTSAAAPEDSNTVQPAAVRDGSHDFDFIYGKWRMPNHHLKERLAKSDEWGDFISCDEGGPLPGGIGDIDYWKANFWKETQRVCRS